jgi:hypothetical protein
MRCGGELIEAHEGTSNVKSAKLFIYKGKFEKFALLPNEELKDNFSHLNNVVNELEDLRFDVPKVDISHKFLRALPPKYKTIVTLLVRSNLKTITHSEILGEILTHDMFKQSQEELHGNLHEDKKKIVAFKVKASNDGNDDDSETSTDDDVALMVKKFMKKKHYQGGSSKSGKSYRENPFTKKNALSVVKWFTSPQIARTKMTITQAIRSFKATRNCSRSTIRRRMARHDMLSGIRMQVQILILVMMRVMRNPARRILPALLSRRLKDQRRRLEGGGG